MSIKCFVTILSVLTIVALLAAYADAETAYRQAKVTDLSGNVYVRLNGDPRWVKAEKGLVLKQDDEIKTDPKASVTIIFDEEGTFEAKGHDSIKIWEDTELVLAKLSYDTKTKDKATLLELEVGKIVANASKLRTKDSKFEVKTPTSIVGVRGTNYVVEYHPGQNVSNTTAR